MDYRKKWRGHSVIGVTLVGLGINLIAEATIIKSNSPAEFDLGHMVLCFGSAFLGWCGKAANLFGGENRRNPRLQTGQKIDAFNFH